MNSPLVQTVTLSSSANSQQKVITLLNAVTSASVVASVRTVCCYIKIQADTQGGAALYAVGNSNVKVATASSAGSGIGWQLAAAGVMDIGPFTSNQIHLDELFVSSNTASAAMNITVVVR